MDLTRSVDLSRMLARLTAVARHRWTRRMAGLVSIVVVAGFGAWLGIALGGGVRSPLGPVEVGMAIRPAWTGETVVDAHPFGTLLFDSHDAPIRLRVTLENIDQDQAKSMIEDPRLADRLPQIVEDDLRDGIVDLAVRSTVFALGGALITGLVVFRRVKPALFATLAAAVAIAGTGVTVAATYRPQSLVEPRYTGLLAGAPSLVGSAESIVTRFESYRVQLTSWSATSPSSTTPSPRFRCTTPIPDRSGCSTSPTSTSTRSPGTSSARSSSSSRST